MTLESKNFPPLSHKTRVLSIVKPFVKKMGNFIFMFLNAQFTYNCSFYKVKIKKEFVIEYTSRCARRVRHQWDLLQVVMYALRVAACKVATYTRKSHPLKRVRAIGIKYIYNQDLQADFSSST